MDSPFKKFLLNPPEKILTSDNNPSAFNARNLNILSNEYEIKNVKTNEEVEEYISQGWINLKKNPKSFQMGLLKRHDDALEEKVWSLFARMGYPIMGELKKFVLKYDKNLPAKQIDVFAVDEETILIIECKSSEKRRRKDLKKDISEYALLKNELRNAAKKLIPGKQKVAFIFVTNNVIISEPDEERLNKAGIYHLNQDAIKYFEQLTKHLSSGAKYQFMGLLFQGDKIEELKTRVPAIEGKLGKNRYYIFSIEPHLLLKIGYVLHRTDPTGAAVLAYQRLVNKTRIRQIKEFIEDGGFFPNSLIINIFTKRKPQFDLASYGKHDSSTKLGILHLPKNYRSAWIIDGQHRLFGYAHTQLTDKRTVPVVAFYNLDNEEQTKMFVDINSKQKGVSRNLLNSIMSEFGWGSKDIKIAMDALKSRIISDLDGNERSPFYKRVILSEEDESPQKCLTLTFVKSYGLNHTKFFGVIGKVDGENKIVEIGTLWTGTIDKTLIKSLDFFHGVFSFVAEDLEIMWEAGKGPGGFISMNVGVCLIIRLSDSIVNMLEAEGKITPRKMSGGDLAAEVVIYLEPALQYLKELSQQDIAQMRASYRGSGAVKNLLPNFQDCINKKFPKYLPNGLEQWRSDSTGEFKDKCYKLGDNLERDIFEYIINVLKENYGKKLWWYDGIPGQVGDACVRKKQAEQSYAELDTFLGLIDALKIIKKNKELLINTFTPPDLKGNIAIDKKLNWIEVWSGLRNRYSHPRKPELITEEEYLWLKDISEWIYERIH